MHISITGDLGSGKSTVAKEICHELNYMYLSTGLIQRQLGIDKGMDTLEFNKYSDDNKEVDDYIDQKLKDINYDSNLYVLDSRLAWFFVKNSFKVYLMTIDEVAASRVLTDKKRIGEPLAKDIQSKINDLKERQRSENNRFKKSYGIEPDIFRNFDLIIDTSTATISEVTSLILTQYKKWQTKEKFNRLWLSPLRLFPTENIRTIAHHEAGSLSEEMTKNGFDDNFPVSCVLCNEDFYLFDGHKRLSAALYNKLSFIPVQLLAKDLEEVLPSINVIRFVNDSLNLSAVYDWEDAHTFKFFHYPVVLNTAN